MLDQCYFSLKPKVLCVLSSLLRRNATYYDNHDRNTSSKKKKKAGMITPNYLFYDLSCLMAAETRERRILKLQSSKGKSKCLPRQTSPLTPLEFPQMSHSQLLKTAQL
jgi:hypothetical protein